MFTQASARTANPWAIGGSIFLQSMTISAAILIPLWRIEPLPPVKLAEPRVAPPHIKLVAVPRAVREAIRSALSSPVAQPVAPRPLVVPRSVPAEPQSIIDLAEDFPVASTAATTIASNQGLPFNDPQALVVRPPAQPTREPVSAPAPPNSKPLPVGGDVKAPVLRSAAKPVYPILAKQGRIQGTVRLSGVIARDGTVRSLELVSGHPLLVRAALDAVRAWLYEPGRLNGQPVDVILMIDVNFTLSQ